MPVPHQMDIAPDEDTPVPHQMDIAPDEDPPQFDIANTATVSSPATATPPETVITSPFFVKTDY